MSNKKQMFIEKIPIEDLLDALEFLYDKGATYVDIQFIQEEIDENNEDVQILFSAKEEYYIDEGHGEDNDEDDESTPLSENNLNDLIL